MAWRSRSDSPVRSIARSRITVAIVASLATAAIGLGTGMASVPDSNGAVHACYKVSGSSLGRLRVIDPSKGQHCNSNEAALTIGRRGLRGLTGPKGAQGVPGATGGPGAIGGSVAFIDPADTEGFAGLGGQQSMTTLASAATSLPTGGVIGKLLVSADPVGGGTVGVTIIVNGSASSITCSIATSGSSCSDAVHQMTVPAGGTVAARVDKPAGADVTHLRFTLKFTGS
jgi:hypothetical protein